MIYNVLMGTLNPTHSLTRHSRKLPLSTVLYQHWQGAHCHALVRTPTTINNEARMRSAATLHKHSIAGYIWITSPVPTLPCIVQCITVLPH